MNILLISRCPPFPIHFGDRLIIWHLVRELSGRGHNFDLMALTQLPGDSDDVPRYEQLFQDIHLFPEVYRSPWMYLKRLSGSHYPESAESAWQSDMWKAIEAQLEKRQYDVIHLFGGIHIYEFANLLNAYPTVITPYESYSLYLKRAFQQKKSLALWINRQIARRFESWMFSPYQYTVVLTEEDKAELAKINSRLAIEVIPNGIDLHDFKPSHQQRDKATLLFVGNYEYPPNHDAAIFLATEIFPRVLEAIPDAELQLVGNAPSEEMLSMASENIRVTGRVERVQDYLEKATMFVCPLRVGAGIKNKILEALACGIPTIGSPLSFEGISAQHGTDALIVETGNMGQTIIKALNSPALLATLSQSAPALIKENYSWSGVASRYETLYEDAMRS